VDAIDTVKGKLELIVNANKVCVPIISCMGAGNKTDPSRLRVSDIYSTSVCPLAKVMRYELKKRKIKKLKVVWSDENPIIPVEDTEISCKTHCVCPPGTVRKCTVRRQIPGSNAFVPPAAGLLIASEIVKDLSCATFARKGC
jgi:tRNA A37 threonylcarbamoyladenosine dehydratase